MSLSPQLAPAAPHALSFLESPTPKVFGFPKLSAEFWKQVPASGKVIWGGVPLSIVLVDASLLADGADWLKESHLARLQKGLQNHLAIVVLRSLSAQPQKTIDEVLATLARPHSRLLVEFTQADSSAFTDLLGPTLSSASVAAVFGQADPGGEEAVAAEALATSPALAFSLEPME